MEDFEKVKDMVTTAPVPAFNDVNKPTVVSADPSSLACSKRSDSGERCGVKKAMKSRGRLGREDAWNTLLAATG